MSEELLRLNKLCVDYKVKDGYLSAVKDVSFSINKGEIFAIVGESGCGKSTIAHSILHLLPEHNEIIKGNIFFNGEDINQYTDKQLESIRGKEIGMIFQNPIDSLNPVYTTGFQVAEGIMLDNVSKTEAWNRVIKLYNDVKMPDAEKRAQSFPHELSGGMRQRVMIAMMLARTPKLLIADEPTTALDVTIEAQILNIIKSLRDEYNTAVMLITHNFGLVAEVADNVAVMYAGEILEQGTVFDIFDNPKHPYTKLLMKALPRKTKKEGRLQTIDGNVPRLTNDKPGCRFENRCPYAMDICKSNDAEKIMVTESHSFNCHMGGVDKQ
ncbi:MAG TPA: peptide ABC transporter ATP-binding protein [Clostridiales bacterium]|nr:peptide ABC transporter ATP-binding protein [Clostridiales bacterium]